MIAIIPRALEGEQTRRKKTRRKECLEMHIFLSLSLADALIRDSLFTESQKIALAASLVLLLAVAVVTPPPGSGSAVALRERKQL